MYGTLKLLLWLLQNFIRTFKMACNFNGDAMMVIPDGEFLIGPVMFSGPCFNPSPLIIQFNGNIKAQADLTRFGGAGGSDWINFQAIDGLILSGHGTLHGQGALAWKNNNCAGRSSCDRLPAVSFQPISEPHTLWKFCALDLPFF